MNHIKVRVSFALSLFITLVTAVQPVLFHGTSIVIRPSNISFSPANSTLYAANFFCYMTDKGYLSFGWWVPTSIDGDASRYLPDSREFHWYECAERKSCDTKAGTCLYQTLNTAVRQPEDAEALPFPPRPLQYVIQPMDIGNRHYGRIAASYIDDKDISFYAAGTREVISGARNVSQCRKALATLKHVAASYKPDMGFDLEESACVGEDLAVQGEAIGGIDEL